MIIADLQIIGYLTFRKRFKGSGGRWRSPGAFGTFFAEKYTSKDLSVRGS